MHVQFSTFMPNFAVNNKKQNTPFTINQSYSNSLKQDLFVKSNAISFKANESQKIGRDLISDLTVIGIVCAPFLLSIAAASKLAKNSNPEDIFLPDGMYFMNTNEFKLESDKITADGDDGIFKVKGTGVDLDASKYDIADVEHGIYKNYDGSVDIDLMHNKYIDSTNGIFIDPASKVAVIESNGELLNIQLPSFGSGYPTCPWDPRWDDSYLLGSSDQYRHEDIPLTRSQYKELFGYEPENDPHGIQAKGEILSDRTLMEKMKDFFSGGSKEKYDIFGRKFFDFADKNGDMHKIALDDETSEIIDKFHIKGDAVPELAKFVDNLKLEQYITHSYPDFKDLLTPRSEVFQEFVNKLHSIDGNADVSDGLNPENVPHIDLDIDTENIPESDGSFLHSLIEHVKEIF